MKKLYELVIETKNEEFVRKTVIATSKGDAKKKESNEIIRIKEITEKFPISIKCLKEALSGKFGETETTIILQALKEGYENIVE